MRELEFLAYKISLRYLKNDTNLIVSSIFLNLFSNSKIKVKELSKYGLKKSSKVTSKLFDGNFDIRGFNESGNQRAFH